MFWAGVTAAEYYIDVFHLVLEHFQIEKILCQQLLLRVVKYSKFAKLSLSQNVKGKMKV